MKKTVVSVGLVALSVASVRADYGTGLSGMVIPQNPWSVSATLRGFYDDNINGAASGPAKVGSFGIEVSPSLGMNWAFNQTLLNLDYTFSLKDYEKTPAGNAESYDMTHTFDVALDHAFNERYHLTVSDSFVIGQEPDVLRTGNAPLSVFQRLPGDNIANYGNILLNIQVTRLFGVELGYANTFIDYSQHGAVILSDGTLGVPIGGGNYVPGPSYSGTLDRIEQTMHVDGHWQVQRQTIAVVGYQFSMADYTGNEPIWADPLIMSDARNSRTHYGYVGVDQTFNADLSASVRAGARYTDFYNDPSGENDLSPYALLSLRYVYAIESYVEAGFTYDRSATDRVSFNNGSVTDEAESAVLYATLVHRITPKLYGTLTGAFQNSTYLGGGLANESDRYFQVGVNLEYRINPHFSADVGYNFDKLDSDIGRSYDRDRVYLGVTAKY